MNEEFLKNILNDLSSKLDSRVLDIVEQTIQQHLSLVLVTTGENKELENREYLSLFLSAKRVEGCSEKSMNYYETTISKLLNFIEEPLKYVKTDSIRTYLANYQESRKSSKVTIDNMRRIFSSFFSWLEDEDYILKSPVRRIRKVKSAKVIKEAFSDEEIEKLRDNSSNLRDLAMVEFLNSTGVRVGELVRLNREDIRFNDRSCVVLGKGDAEREVYFDARTKLHLKEYLNSRSDNQQALFASKKSPFNRLKINGVENVLKKLGEISKVNNVHPHKFRRTLATMAIDKGMPIEQVQKLLGHVRIDTTLHYAMVNQTNVKNAHRKYIG